MLLNQLSIAYKCHSSIGNSLILQEMINEVLGTFIQETDALHGSFYLLEESCELIASIGKTVSYDMNELCNEIQEEQLVLKKLMPELNIVLFKLESSLLVFVYHESVNLEFILNIFESFRTKLNISIRSCLNVQRLKEKNITLEEEVIKVVARNKEKERQFFEQLQMAQMGELIGNIAHQWRQPLSVISTTISGMRLKKEMDILSDDNFYEYCDGVLNHVMMLSQTIDEFRDYIKESNKEKEIVVQDRIKMAFTMVESSYKVENIQIIPDVIENNPITFRLVLGELLQAILPILNNAKEALMQQNKPEKWVKYSVYSSDYYIVISIEDNAGGIPLNILDKIFNPYFTTKHQKQGTGIGLYTCYDVIVNHLNGNLRVENTANGAKFFIELPLKTDYII
jgi:signal transduction histidine kinase